MFSVKEMPSPSSLFSAYASITASMMLFRSMINELIPRPVRDYLVSVLHYLFRIRSKDLTLIIEEEDGISNNQLYRAAEIFLGTKISLSNERIKIYKTPKEKGLKLRLEKGEKIVDNFEGIVLEWRFVCKEAEKNDRRGGSEQQKWFELSFVKKHKEKVLDSYIPFVLERSKAVTEEERVLKMHTLNDSRSYGSLTWDSVNLEHPSTFETLAMEPDLKNAVIEDLNRFIKRRKFYRRVGRAWKRGYLLYGPPGTGKSSLVAAMANYLKFDVYDLQLGNIMRDSELRRLLLATGNRSILVIEDIDCSVDFPERKNKLDENDQKQSNHFHLTLSGLLNFIDGLWSSCGDERIVVFTTNHKEKLDPALLRPGRMDMHVHMSYCTFEGFKMLASSYLEISDYHELYGEIECLLGSVKLTPAQVAEELMKSEDADVALEGLVKLLKQSLEADEIVDEAAIIVTQEAKNGED